MTDDPLGNILLFVAPVGLAGVFLMALLERIVPVLPSYGLYAAIGVAAAEGAWGLPAAIIMSVLGSGAGAFATYRVGIRIAAGEGRAVRIRRLLRRRGRLGRYLRAMQRRSGTLPFVAQLLPAARLVAPFVAGATLHDWRRLSIATLAGLTVWNTTFIAIGFVMVRLGGQTNVTVVSATILALLAGFFVVMRLARHRRIRPASTFPVYRSIGV